MNNSKLRQLTVWRTEISGVPIEINMWEQTYMRPLTKAWTYYIYIQEAECREGVFDKLWLEDKPVQFTPTSPVRITHDYYLPEFDELELHCGITYYDKLNHSVGSRCVKVGCDFSHLWDQERGYDWTLEEVLQLATRSAELTRETLLKPVAAEVPA